MFATDVRAAGDEWATHDESVGVAVVAAVVYGGAGGGEGGDADDVVTEGQ